MSIFQNSTSTVIFHTYITVHTYCKYVILDQYHKISYGLVILDEFHWLANETMPPDGTRK